jgi:hypothetical protein
VQVYDYVDHDVPKPARTYERRLKGYSTTGYAIEQEAPPQSHETNAESGAHWGFACWGRLPCHFFCNYLFALGCEMGCESDPDHAHPRLLSCAWSHSLALRFGC